MTGMQESDYLAHLDQLWARHWPEGVSRTPHYPLGERPLTDYLRLRAQRHPDKPVLVFYGREISFRELDALSDRFAALLQARGVRSGDRVAVFLPNCPQFLVAFYGILKLGAVHVPVNPLFRAQEVLYQLQDSGARVLLALDQIYGVVAPLREAAGLRHVWTTSFQDMLPAEPTLPLPAALALPRVDCPGTEDLMDALRAASAAPELPPADLDALAALNYTGGTTGLPKGCMHTQRHMLYTAATTATVSVDEREDDIALGVNPVFWIAGENSLVIAPVFGGCTTVMLARWDPLAWMQAVERYRVTLASLVLDTAVEVMDHPQVGDHALGSLRDVRVASFVKKLSVAYRERWRSLTGTTMREAAWGMTETHTMDTFTRGMQQDDFDLRQQPVFVGLPMPGTRFKIASFDTGALCPLGQEGELCCSTPSLFDGYWQRPEATADAIRDGWLHTGDIGLLDPSGYLHFLGRSKEMLKVKGMPVFPAEIEALLGMHPGIVGSGVIGRPDPERGEVPVAFVVLDAKASGPAPDAAQLVAWCREHMAVYKVPEIRIVDELPKTATGKVIKHELVKRLG
jgi:long-chain acyl-CoA synthetase